MNQPAKIGHKWAIVEMDNRYMKEYNNIFTALFNFSVMKSLKISITKYF